MVPTIGILLLLLGLVGAASMLYFAIRSTQVDYHVKCKNCGLTTAIPRKKGEYHCEGCGVPLAKIKED